MALPTSGKISLQDIRTEFGPSFNLPVAISSYYKGGLYVKRTTTNAKVPLVGNPIKFSDFRGAAKYVGGVTIDVYSEIKSQYANKNDGEVVVTPTGNSPSYTISCTSRSPRTTTAGNSVSFGSYDSSDDVTITITDASGTYSFGPYSIGYSSTNQYNDLTTYGPYDLNILTPTNVPA